MQDAALSKVTRKVVLNFTGVSSHAAGLVQKFLQLLHGLAEIFVPEEWDGTEISTMNLPCVNIPKPTFWRILPKGFSCFMSIYRLLLYSTMAV